MFPPKDSFDSKVARLKDRAHMFKTVRQFFDLRQVTEVDCPIITAKAPIDLHIDLIEAVLQNQPTRYLHSSPEFGMKRLISEGMGDIYQMSHVFRDEEWSCKHNPEFTMVEWYRLNYSFEQMIQETIDFIKIFFGEISSQIISYRELFLKYTNIDYVTSSEQDLFSFIQKNEIPYYQTILEEGKDALLNLILGFYIEPKITLNELVVLAYYPASQAALAKTTFKENVLVAERFEIYYQGLELANGYHELSDPKEQLCRFQEANQQRLHFGKKELPIDDNFLEALNKGFPDCSGVAVGFDRLMMIRQSQNKIENVLCWDWSKA